jgi:hypothetical protein
MSDLRDRSGTRKPKRLCILRSHFGGGRDILVYVMGRPSGGGHQSDGHTTKRGAPTHYRRGQVRAWGPVIGHDNDDQRGAKRDLRMPEMQVFVLCVTSNALGSVSNA